MLTPNEKERGESDPEPALLWFISFNFTSIIDKIKKYLAKRKLRRILKNRVELSKARKNASKL